MTINRDNYEAWFLQYVDNELSPLERQSVDAFVNENPDLQIELMALLDTRLLPDPFEFPNKASLYQIANTNTLTNEQWIALLDKELPPAEAAELLQQIANDPNLARTWASWQDTQLIPENIPFPHRETLYRSAPARVRPIAFWRYAAAAVLLSAVAWGGWQMLAKPNAAETVKSGTTQPAQTLAKTATQTAEQETTAPIVNSASTANQTATAITATTTTSGAYTKNATASIVATAATSGSEKKSNASSNFSNPTNVSNDKNLAISNTPVAELTVPENPKPATPVEPSNYASLAALQDAPAGYSLNDDEFDDDDAPRSKVGGLLRRVKRTLNGNAQANQKTGKKVRVAAFEIAVQ